MNITAEILRDCAYGLPREEDSKDALLDDMEMARTGSPFICDHLNRMVEVAEEQQLYVAREFLHELGMGVGMAEFLVDDEDGNQGFGFNRTVKQQTLRAWWLLFAADLAEEWGV
jgi:hypothetical protein